MAGGGKSGWSAARYVSLWQTRGSGEPLAVWLRMVQMVHWPDLSVLAGGRALEWLGPREGSWAGLRVGAGVDGGDRPVACTALTPIPPWPALTLSQFYCENISICTQLSEVAQRPVCPSLPVSCLLPGSLGSPHSGHSHHTLEPCRLVRFRLFILHLFLVA